MMPQKTNIILAHIGLHVFASNDTHNNNNYNNIIKNYNNGNNNNNNNNIILTRSAANDKKKRWRKVKQTRMVNMEFVDLQ